DGPNQLYSELQTSTSTNYNHRLNARLEYDINENNSLMIRPSLSFQDNSAQRAMFGSSVLETGLALNSSDNRYLSDNSGFNSRTEILYRHRFNRPGRTISANLEIGLNDRWGETDQESLTSYFI